LLDQASWADARQDAICGELLTSYGQQKLKSLCRTTGFAKDEASILRVFDVLTAGWEPQLLGLGPEWKSDISDDHTPFEFALSPAGNRSELRILVEAQVERMTLASGWQAGLALNDRLRREYGVSLGRFRRIQDLFLPRWQGMRFSMWHAASCLVGERPNFEVCLNPASRNPREAGEVVQQALGRLELDRAWSFLHRVLQTDPQSRLLYFSLDLDHRQAARVKVYIAHMCTTAERVDRALSTCGRRAFDCLAATDLCRDWVGHEGPFDARPLLTSYVFTAGRDTRPDEVTLHFPIRSYCADDAEAMNRIVKTLPPQDRETYRASVTEFAGRPLEDGVGMQSYLSVRKERGLLHSAVSLAAEAYAVKAAGQALPRHLQN
jgi:DMATS type aromatic prenyltransferase